MDPVKIIEIIRILMADLIPVLEAAAADTNTPVDDITIRIIKAVLGYD